MSGNSEATRNSRCSMWPIPHCYPRGLFHEEFHTRSSTHYIRQTDDIPRGSTKWGGFLSISAGCGNSSSTSATKVAKRRASSSEKWRWYVVTEFSRLVRAIVNRPAWAEKSARC